MKNPITFFLVLSLFFAISCKKKNAEANINATIAPLVPQKIDGYIETYYYYKISKDTSKYHHSIIFAMFSKQSNDIDSLDYLPFVADVGDININGNILGKSSDTSDVKYYYYPSFSEIEQNKRVWNVSGNESFKKMSFIDTTFFPEYFSTVIPDTIFKANNILKLGNYTGKNPIGVQIVSPKGNGATIGKTVSRATKEIEFTTLDFSLFNDYDPSTTVTINFELTSTSYQIIEGKVLRFTLHIMYETEEIPFKF